MRLHIIVYFMILFSLSCRVGNQDAKKFCRHDINKRLEIYREYSIEDRFNLFININNEATCDADSIAGSGYLVDRLVVDDKDIDFLSAKLKETNEEQIQQQIIWVLERNPNRLKGRHEIADLTIEKANSMTGTLFDRIVGRTIAVNSAREKAYRIKEMANSN